MKTFLTIIFLITTSLFYAQAIKSNEAAYLLDSNLVSQITIKHLVSDEIESVNIKKNDTIINDKHFSGVVSVTSKNPHKFDFLNLEEIKSEFTTIKKSDVVFMINGEIIKDNLNSVLLDRNYILKVEVTNSQDFYKLRETSTKHEIINILGKTKENLDNKTKIILKGHESIGIK
ncbi:hypothetical protein SAMN05444396_104366 [Flavobacterium segetis]|uniref:Uncharacterized protein n=1 Tax=Flavobacterium segetis TaxID=271157 RepID=A0A1M5H4E8_9FLAO|nr:hypothetical protein [Flavobacterium segetis]SHG10877.1 hypothetical protein SAMN05444396_104366 [Flavobacterium segetis]